jgi:hypothetical protein
MFAQLRTLWMNRKHLALAQQKWVEIGALKALGISGGRLVRPAHSRTRQPVALALVML